MVFAPIHQCCCPSNSRCLKLPVAAVSKEEGRRVLRRRRPPHVHISTNPSHVSPTELRDLFSCCNLSCHRFPNLDADGRVEPLDLQKLRIALSHSTVVVSVFCKPQGLKPPPSSDFLDALRDTLMPVTPFNGQLVGFGRAVSDNGLTASIYDVMVDPSLRKVGIGRKIVRRIIRMLTSKGVYDIAALCSKEERLFFEACGFGDDIIGNSTAMMYKRVASSYPDDSSAC
ncbi:GCN5-related N-acetyltransferase 3, chloroplastic [Malania oleifera]|uniref:GCN5-related N-acetyltransferase 3, chloroplastic n=1 Tax=Malania oleifera TaxID=397392 RepID=UPI0025AE6571|nr:GCN5-related N-acetyltransferase 3, chloroplastic [Malania oleifera]